MKQSLCLLFALAQLAWAGPARADTPAPLAIGPDVLPVFTVGQSFNCPLVATGGAPPYVWSALSLPPGFSLHSPPETLTGTPSAAGNFVLFLRATDANGSNTVRGWNVHVGNAASPPPAGGSVPPPVNQYPVTVANGTLPGGATNGLFTPGATVSVTALTPPSGQWFAQWSGGVPVANSQAPATTFTMPAQAVQMTAQFYTPPAPAKTIASHPRLWVTTNELPRLRSWAGPGNPVFTQGLKSVLNTAVLAYHKCFPNGVQPASPYPDLGDNYGYSAALITSDLVSEEHALTLAFFALVDNNASNRVHFAQMAQQMLMYEMNEAAKGHANGAPFRDPFFALFNRTHNVGEMWPLIVDWLQGVTDANGQLVPILSAQDKLTIRNMFMLWANDCFNASVTGGDHPSPIGVVNNPALLPHGNAMRVAANNYYGSHARLVTMMPLALDPADDPALNPGAPDGLLGNTLRSYLLDATGAWLYQQFAIYGDPAAVRSLYGLSTNSAVGLSSGGLPVEGTLYGHSYAYVLGELLALQTAGLNDPALAGPQIALINAPVWDRYVTGLFSELVNTPKIDPNVAYLGQIYQFASYGDTLRLYATPDLSEPFALLTLLQQHLGSNAHRDEARWLAINATTGGAANFLQRVASPWSTAESILYFLLMDPALPPPADPRPGYATTFFDAPQARLLARSGWSANDTLFTYRAAPESINHVNCDAGQFELWRNGEWLTKELGNYDNYGNGQSTLWHNTLALKNWCPGGVPYLNPFEQNYFPNGSTWNNGASAGDPVTWSSLTNGYEFLQTDLTPLYNRPSPYQPTNALLDVLHASRSILHWNRDYVVVYDRATTAHAGLFKHFNLNFTTQPYLDYVHHTITETTPGGQHLFVQSVLPANPGFTWVTPGNTVTTLAETEPTVGRVVIEDPTNPSDVRFLHVLQAADHAAPMDPAVLVQSFAGDAFDGLLINHTAILFARHLGVAFGGTSYNVPASTLTHFLSGLTPGAGYDASTVLDQVGNRQVNLVPGTQLTADSAGAVTFSIAPGN